MVRSVTDAPDPAPGDGTATSTNGSVTLRSAIEETNLLDGEQIIYFYIKDVNPVIQPDSALPSVTQPVFMDGTFQPGYAGEPIVQIGGPFGGLNISGGNSTVQGLNMNATSGYSLILIRGR